MRIVHIIGSLAVFGGLVAGFSAPGWTQQPSDTPIALPQGRALSDEETRAFDARLRAAGTDDVRVKITRERDDLVRSRLVQGDQIDSIPASANEKNDDLIMPDVPTPPLERSWEMTPAPGGAFAPMTTGSNPFGHLVLEPQPQ